MKKLIFLFLLLKFDFNSEAQGTFQKTFGGGSAYSVEKTNDGNLIITGDPMFLLKMDPNGNVLWHKSYSSISGAVIGSSVVQTTDGGFIIAGTLNLGSPTSKVVLVKTDSNGNPLWSKTYGGNKSESANGVINTLDGGYAIIGTTKSFGTNFDDIYVIKTDSNGNLQWSRDIADSPTDFIDYGNSIVQNSDGSYAICVRIGNPVTNSNDIGVMKFSQNGVMQWVKCYGGTGDDGGNYITTTSDGGYAVAGYTESFGAGNKDIYVLKTDNAGNLNWSKVLGGVNSDAGNFIDEMSDGTYFLTGSAYLSGNRWIVNLKFDPNGNNLANNFFGGTNGQDGYDLVKIGSGFITVGVTTSFGPDEIYIIKADSLGNSGCYESSQIITVTSPATVVTSPSIQVSTPLTVVNTISFTTSNVSTVNTLCSLVSVPEVHDDPFVMDGAKLVHIYDVLGRQVNQVYFDNVYICQYIDDKGNSFFRKEIKVQP